MRFALFTLSVVLAASSFFAQAKMYKWVDEEGQMHFGDKIPPKYRVKEHDELNDHGVKTRHREAAKTAEEKAEEMRLENERKEAVIAEEKQKKLDLEVLDIYSSERDLVIARDSRINAIATQVEMSEAVIGESNKIIEITEKQIARIKASNREVPINLYNRIDSEKQHVVMQMKVMNKHKKRSDEILVQFNGYIKRFRVAQSR